MFKHSLITLRFLSVDNILLNSIIVVSTILSNCNVTIYVFICLYLMTCSISFSGSLELEYNTIQYNTIQNGNFSSFRNAALSSYLDFQMMGKAMNPCVSECYTLLSQPCIIDRRSCVHSSLHANSDMDAMPSCCSPDLSSSTLTLLMIRTTNKLRGL
jgi:hypothetical protein